MFRKDVVVAAGGYSGAGGGAGVAATAANTATLQYCPCEDYDLWLRVLAIHPFSITNMPDVGIVLRQHSSSKSSRESVASAAYAQRLRELALLESISPCPKLLCTSVYPGAEVEAEEEAEAGAGAGAGAGAEAEAGMVEKTDSEHVQVCT